MGTLSLSAQDAPARLILDVPQMVTLDGNGPVDLVYTTAEPGFVSITVQSLEAPGVLDTTLEVLGPDGYRLPGGFNDDLLDDLGLIDSSIHNLWLPVPGTYTVRINSFNGVSQGTVEVRLGAGNLFVPVTNQYDRDFITAAVLPAYRVFSRPYPAAAGDVITITARDTSGTLDPIVALRSPTGEILATNDDHPPSPDLMLNTFDAQIVAFAVPDDGTYMVEMWDFTGAAGTFELVVAWE